MKTPGLFFLLFMTLLFSGCVRNKEEDPDPETSLVRVGDKIPAFKVVGKMDGEAILFDSSALGADLTLICLFNPGCGDCQREHPKLDRVWKELKDEPGFRMVNIVRQMSLETLAEKGGEWMNMPCYPDSDREIYNLFATSYIPRIYLVDQNGIILQMWVEYLWDDNKNTLTAGEFLAIVKEWLKKS